MKRSVTISVSGVELPAPGMHDYSRKEEQSRAAVREDSELVRAAQGGDRSSFGQLYEKYARMVHGLLLSKIPFSEADDLTQEVFLKALRQLASLRDAAKFGGWLAAIARNLANDYHRRAVPEEAMEENSAEHDASHATTTDAAELSGEGVLGVVRSLPDAYRETLILRLVEGMTGPEIAARTGLTPGSVRVNLHRGMQMLRERLQRPPFSQKQGDPSASLRAGLGQPFGIQAEEEERS